MASTGFKQGGAVLKEFKAKRRQLWQYLNTSVDYFLRAVGLRTTSEIEINSGGPAPFTGAAVTKCENETYNLAGEVYSVYRFQGIQQTMTSIDLGGGVWGAFEQFGNIRVSVGPLIVVSDSSTVVADGGSGSYEHTPLANGASLVDDVTLSSGFPTDFASFLYLLQSNAPQVEDNFINVSGAALFEFGGELYLDFKFIVQQDAEVTFETI